MIKSNKSAIVDIDGTIADLTHRLHHIQGEKKDWDRFHAECGDDGLIEETASVVNAMYKQGWKIILMTGRGAENRERTVRWLRQHYINWDMLLMREAGNFEPDVDCKRRWLHMLRDGRLSMNYAPSPTLAFEDRKRVADMWREEGLIVYHVAAGEF